MVSPGVMLMLAGESWTDAVFGGRTVSAAPASFLPVLAVMTVAPGRLALTLPVAETLATVVSWLVHVSDRLSIGLPDASSATALKSIVLPRVTLACSGCTVMLATGGNASDAGPIAS